MTDGNQPPHSFLIVTQTPTSVAGVFLFVEKYAQQKTAGGPTVARDYSVATSSPEAACQSRSQGLNSLASQGKKETHCPETTVFCRVNTDSFFKSPVSCALFEQGTTTGFPFRSSSRKSLQVYFCASSLAMRYRTPSTSWISAPLAGTFSILFHPLS